MYGARPGACLGLPGAGIGQAVPGTQTDRSAQDGAGRRTMAAF